MDLNKAIISTCISEIITAPLSLIKTKVINTNISPNVIIKDIYIKEGFSSFYKAIGPTITNQVILISFKHKLYTKYPEKDKLFYNIISGILVTFITTPIDVIKINKQMNGIDLFNKPMRFFYKSFDKALYKSITSSFLYFPLYDYFRKEFNNEISSFTSAFISTTIIHPIDYIKTRQMFNLDYNYKNLYNGYSLNLLKCIPTFMISIKINEYLTK